MSSAKLKSNQRFSKRHLFLAGIHDKARTWDLQRNQSLQASQIGPSHWALVLLLTS